MQRNIPNDIAINVALLKLVSANASIQSAGAEMTDIAIVRNKNNSGTQKLAEIKSFFEGATMNIILAKTNAPNE